MNILTYSGGGFPLIFIEAVEGKERLYILILYIQNRLL